jgi:hypothetical protein
MSFIRNKVPILDVAKTLGLKTRGKSAAHCWRADSHKNGDRTASISFHKNRAKCFVCDTRQLSTIDLVMAHEQCALPEAVAWIAERWDVPAVANHSNKLSPAWSMGRVGVGSFPAESLVRAGFWASLDDAGRAVLGALRSFADPLTCEATISIRALCRYSGKKSRATISKVIHQFECAGLLQVSRAKDGIVWKVSTYRFTPDNSGFPRLLGDIHERLLRERDQEILQVKSESTPPGGAARLPKSRTMTTVVNHPPSHAVHRSEPPPKSQSAEGVVQCSEPPIGKSYNANGFKEGNTSTRICRIHRKNTASWWYRGDGEGVCALCHPNPAKERAG